MEKNVHKVYIRNRSDKTIDYASADYLLNFLQENLKTQDKEAVLELLKLLKKSKMDSVSITKDKPYRYFYARIIQDAFNVKLKTLKKEFEFKVPVEVIT